MKPVSLLIFFVVVLIELFDCQDIGLPTVQFQLYNLLQQNSLYIKLLIGGQEILIAVGANISPIALTGHECAHNGKCGMAPGYNIKDSSTRNKSFESNQTSFKIINVFIPGVNDRLFNGEVVQDQICPKTETGAKDKCVVMNFFKINKILEGDKFSSNGRLGFDYDPALVAEQTSYIQVLKQSGFIQKLYVTFEHSKFGNYSITFGARNLPKTAVWFPFRRVDGKMNGYRHFDCTQIGFENLILVDQLSFVKIDNGISGILFKTNDFNEIETFKDNLSNLIGNYAVVNMEGSMVTSVVVPMNCTAFMKTLGPLNMTIGKQIFSMSIWSFLTPSVDKKQCKLDLQIQVFQDQQDQLILGQRLFHGYNVSFDYETDQVGFSEYQIEPDTNLDPVSLSLFSVMMILVLLATAFMIYYTLYKKRVQKGGEAALIDNNQESSNESEKSQQRRSSSVRLNIN